MALLDCGQATSAAPEVPVTQEDLNVKKDRPPVRPVRLPVGAVRRTMFATSELLRGISLASADGWRAFSNAVDPEVSEDDDLVRDVTDAVFDANRSYFENVGATSRRFVDVLLDEGGRMGVGATPEIDYERLAKLVAAEMQKNASEAAAAEG
jgi:hypothetical protein